MNESLLEERLKHLFFFFLKGAINSAAECYRGSVAVLDRGADAVCISNVCNVIERGPGSAVVCSSEL